LPAASDELAQGDGRKYIATLRTETWVSLPGAAHDLWQAFLFAPAGEWVEVRLPLARFLKTWRGKLLDGEEEMNRTKVISFGISLAGGGQLEPQGPYQLEVQQIRARNMRLLRDEEV
jgi:NADH dehydrogenase [ubiquinone] 1 alpha subcomplex assembly factor 1